MIFLITNGYIDETYSHYISNFYPESISKEDRDFILALRGRNNNFGYDFKLDKVDEVAKKLHDHEFNQKEILNYSLFEYLFENSKTHTIKFTNFINQLIETENIAFLDGYLVPTSNNINGLFQSLSNATWIWNKIDISYFTKAKKDLYLKFILSYCDTDKIEHMNVENKLSNYISSKNDFISFCKDIDNTKIEMIINSLHVKFISLDNIEENQDLFEYIYNYNLYKINYFFIEKIITLFNENMIDIQLLTTANYSIIKKSSSSYLKRYIEQHIEEYMEDVFFQLDTNTNEDVEVITELLNHEKIDATSKEKIIGMQNMRIKDISHIEDTTLWFKLFLECKVDAEWDNLLAYYTQVNSIDEALTVFLNDRDNYTKLANYKLESNVYDEEFIDTFARHLIWANKLTYESFSSLLQSNNDTYDASIISPIKSNEKIIQMINMDKLILSQNNLNDLSKKDATLPVHLIENKIGDFIKKQNELIITSNDLLLILESNIITSTQKKTIAENIDIDLIDNQVLANKIYTYIKDKEKLDIAYIVKLLENFSKTNNEYKVNLLLAQVDNFTDEVFLELLKYLPDNYAKVANLDGTHTHLKSYTYNKELIEVLKKRNFITKDKPDKNDTIRLIIKNVQK